jgi:hypothetical protein
MWLSRGTKRRSNSSKAPPNPDGRIAYDRAYRSLQNLLLPLGNPRGITIVTKKVICLSDRAPKACPIVVSLFRVAGPQLTVPLGGD